jgi:serine/threonine protein kinase
MTALLKGMRSSYVLRKAEPIASGRLTDILLADDKCDGRTVVIKRFRNELYPESLDGFYREVASLSALQHAHILSILDSSDRAVPGNAAFLVLPHMERGNLRSLLAGRNWCPPKVLLPVLRQAAAGIDFAHANGVVHGDIKPENILLDAQGNAHLADFGVARHFDVEDRVQISVTHIVDRGSSAYLNPEQLANNETSPASDLYTFALVAYEMLTGRLPFDVRAPLYKQMVARVTGDLLPAKIANPQLPDDTADALTRGLATERERRPNGATALVRLLEKGSKWDLFLAHAGCDSAMAEQMFALLDPQVRVFLDSKRLRFGDDWDLALAQAQRESQVTVVLVSAAAEAAFYQREEIAAAIALARQDPLSHRVVPVYLDEASAARPPYGLALKHGLKLGTTMAPQQVAQELIELVRGLD